MTTRSLFNGNTPLDVKTSAMEITCAITSSLSKIPLWPNPRPSSPTTLNSLCTNLQMDLSTNSALLLATNVESLPSLNALKSQELPAISPKHLNASPQKFPTVELELIGSRETMVVAPLKNTRFTSRTFLELPEFITMTVAADWQTSKLAPSACKDFNKLPSYSELEMMLKSPHLLSTKEEKVLDLHTVLQAL